MDRSSLHCGVKKTSKSRNNTIIKNLHVTDVINTFKMSIMVNIYNLNIHALIHAFLKRDFSVFVMTDGVIQLLDIRYYCLSNKIKPVNFYGKKRKHFSQNKV